MTLWQRIQAKTPAWARKTQRWSIGFAAVNGTVAALPNAPAWAVEYCGSLAAALLIAAGVLQLLVEKEGGQ